MWIAEHFLTVLGFALCVLLVVRLLRAHRAPGVTMAWLLAIVLIPYAGVPAYLLFGGRKLRRMAGRKRALFGPPQRDPTDENASSHTAERVLVTAGMPPARRGNQVKFLPDGQAGFASLVSLVEQAKQSVHLMTFILGRDQTGRAIVDLLARKAEEGVEVRLLLDALGCFRTRGRFVEPVREAGGKVAVFMPVLPLRRKWSANLRNHRKIAVVDGQTAIVGGMNLAQEYMGPQLNPNRWLDTGAVVRGPAAADLDAVFSSDWNFASDEPLRPSAGASPIPVDEIPNQFGESIAQVAASGPDTLDDAMYEAIFTATVDAKQRIWIVTPYFIPDEPLLKALMLQTRLGRDVRILVPKRSNHNMADLARGHPLRELARTGAQVYAYKRMLHAKLMLFDSDLALIGSANVDQRSFYLNYEVQLFMYSASDVESTARWMQHRMAESSPLDAGPISPMRRWAEDLSALIAPLL